MKKETRHINIPVFIPHLGCPNNCVFCNQRRISGTQEFHEEDVRGLIESSLSTIPAGCDVEIAFFGGSFTGIDRELMIRLLNLADEYIESGRVQSLRCSTRPDYINEEILSILSEHHMTTVELGIQSTRDSVLAACRRGHSADDSRRACALVKAAGMQLIGQMMVGLPGADEDGEVQTARDIVAFGADGTRVYPTVVFHDTELEDMARRGDYLPLDYDTAAKRCASVLDVFDRASLPVIRVGLCSGEGLSSPQSVYGGANHPAMGELAMGELYFRRIVEAAEDVLSELTATDDCAAADGYRGRIMTVYVRRGAKSAAIGHGRRNIDRLLEKYSRTAGINRIIVLESCELFGYNIRISISGAASAERRASPDDTDNTDNTDNSR